MNTEQEQLTTLKLVREYLPLFIAIVGAAVTWGVFTTRLAGAEAKISEIQTKQTKIDDMLTELRVSVGSIEKSVSFIEKQFK